MSKEKKVVVRRKSRRFLEIREAKQMEQERIEKLWLKEGPRMPWRKDYFTEMYNSTPLGEAKHNRKLVFTHNPVASDAHGG